MLLSQCVFTINLSLYNYLWKCLSQPWWQNYNCFHEDEISLTFLHFMYIKCYLTRFSYAQGGSFQSFCRGSQKERKTGDNNKKIPYKKPKFLEDIIILKFWWVFFLVFWVGGGFGGVVGFLGMRMGGFWIFSWKKMIQEFCFSHRWLK